MNKILITEDDGATVSVMSPSPRRTAEYCVEKNVPVVAKYKIVDVSDIPSDRVFRDAWEVNSSDWETK